MDNIDTFDFCLESKKMLDLHEGKPYISSNNLAFHNCLGGRWPPTTKSIKVFFIEMQSIAKKSGALCYAVIHGRSSFMFENEELMILFLLTYA